MAMAPIVTPHPEGAHARRSACPSGLQGVPTLCLAGAGEGGTAQTFRR